MLHTCLSREVIIKQSNIFGRKFNQLYKDKLLWVNENKFCFPYLRKINVCKTRRSYTLKLQNFFQHIVLFSHTIAANNLYHLSYEGASEQPLSALMATDGIYNPVP